IAFEHRDGLCKASATKACRKEGDPVSGPGSPWSHPFAATGAEERTRTSTGLPPPDPESGVSTNSTTSAAARTGVAMYWKQCGKSRGAQGDVAGMRAPGCRMRRGLEAWKTRLKRRDTAS